MNTFFSSRKAISSLGIDGKAFAIPCSALPESTGAQAGIAMLRLWQREVGGPMMMFVWSVARKAGEFTCSAFVLQTPFPAVHV